MLGAHHLVVEHDLDAVAGGVQGAHGGVLADLRAVPAGQRDVGGVGARRVDDAGAPLVHGLLGAGEAELRPARLDAARVEEVEVDAVPVGHRGVPAEVAPAGVEARARIDVLDDEPAGLGDERLGGDALDVAPGGVGGGGEGGVGVLVLGVADDPRVVLARPVVVPEAVPLEGEDATPGRPGEPVGGGGAEAAAADDDEAALGPGS